MPFEWLVGTRYLSATRRAGAPSVITIISVLAVAIGVAALIFVLAILGGFEGDLRTKILGTKAHLLLTGPSSGALDDYEPVLEAVLATDGVVGASPFVESDVMIASATNYSGIVLRGIDPERLVTTADMAAYMVDGELEWLDDPDAAVRAQREIVGAPNMEEIRGAAEALRRANEELEAERERLGEAQERIRAVVRDQLEAGAGSGDASSDDASSDDGSGAEDPSKSDDVVHVGPPSLADRLGDARGTESADGRPTSVGPPSLADRLAGSGGADGSGARDPGVGPGPIEVPPERTMPGIVIGTELRDSLHVEIGDQVQIINPDGDMGPTGPIPRAWPYRVVGVFYTGLYEYDNTMVYMTLPSSRRFLNVPPEQVTGIEVRVGDMDAASSVGDALDRSLAASGRDEVAVATWMELNDRLFSALMLEQLVIGLLLMIIVLVASFAIVCVLIMIVIQRADEIAIMRSMGASSGNIRRVFVIQGMSIGISGTLIGLAIGLGLVAYLLFVGFPLDANVYYIDRVPVELSWMEVAAVAAGALAISAVATVLPSMQAARLDPAAALRHE